MDNNNNKRVVDPSESCADCKYHHCKRSCQYDNKETCINDVSVYLLEKLTDDAGKGDANTLNHGER